MAESKRTNKQQAKLAQRSQSSTASSHQSSGERSSAVVRSVNIISFHSVKGGVGKTTLCLSTFVQLAARLCKEPVSQHWPIWLIDFDIGGRPMFYLPGVSSLGWTHLDELVGPGALNTAELRERTPQVVGRSRDSGHEITLSSPDTQVQDDQATARLLGMTAERAFAYYRDASPVDYLRLTRRALDFVIESARPPPVDAIDESGASPAAWILIDCPPGFGRATEALVQAIGAAKAQQPDRTLLVLWQPVFVLLPEEGSLLVLESCVKPEMLRQRPLGTFAPASVLNCVRPEEGGYLKLWSKYENIASNIIHQTLPASASGPAPASEETPRRSSVPGVRQPIAHIRSEELFEVQYDDAVRAAFIKASDRLWLPALDWRLITPETVDSGLLSYALDKRLTWLQPAQPAQTASVPTGWVPIEEVHPETRTVPGAALAPRPTSGEQPTAPSGVLRNEVDLSLLLARAELDADEIRSPAAAPILARALELVRQHPMQVEHLRVGNLAVSAERCRLPDLAYALYNVIRDKLAEDFRVASQYISFLLDTHYILPQPDPQARSQDPNKVAAHYLELHGQQAKSWPSDLRARYDRLCTQLPIELQPRGFDPATLLTRARRAFGKRPSEETTRHLIGLMHHRRDLPPEAFEKVADQLARVKPANQMWANEGIRALGDALATRDDADCQETAIRLYRRLKDTELWRPDTKHNLASLLARRHSDPNRMHEATQLWVEAYTDAQQDPNIVRGFSQHLKNLNQPRLARCVLNSQPVSLKDINLTAEGL